MARARIDGAQTVRSGYLRLRASSCQFQTPSSDCDVAYSSRLPLLGPAVWRYGGHGVQLTLSCKGDTMPHFGSAETRGYVSYVMRERSHHHSVWCSHVSVNSSCLRFLL